MIVFSQDKMSFVNFDRIDSFSVEASQEGFSIFADNYDLGIFSEEEKAKSVLKDICNCFSTGSRSYQIEANY